MKPRCVAIGPPGRPESGHGERTTVSARDVHRFLRSFRRTWSLVDGSPFVEPVHRNDAPSARHEVSERGFVENSFRAGIHESRRAGRILGPRRDEAPLKSAETSAPFTIDRDGQDSGRGCDVVARTESGDVVRCWLGLEQLSQFTGGCEGGESTAHTRNVLRPGATVGVVRRRHHAHDHDRHPPA